MPGPSVDVRRVVSWLPSREEGQSISAPGSGLPGGPAARRRSRRLSPSLLGVLASVTAFALALNTFPSAALAQQPAATSKSPPAKAPSSSAKPPVPPGGAAPPLPPPSPPPDPGADAYRQHMDVGISLYEQKNYVAAIAEFEEAYKAKAKASPLVNIALCHKAMFAYPKAIRALEAALDGHADTMDDNDERAAHAEIEEMRALLSYVTFKVTPGKFAVQIDGEAYPEAAEGKPVAVSPGPHEVEVTAEGYEPARQRVTLASGARTLEVALRPNMGFVRIKAASARYAIAVDQKALDYGEWAGLLPPGPHVIEMYVPGATTPPYRVRLDVEVGKAYEVSPGRGGVPLVGVGPAPAPPIPPPPKPPSPPVRGPFFLASISAFAPTEQPAAFTGENLSPGVTAGLRVGYRVNTPVSFDAMFEYSNVLVSKEQDQEVTYNLEEVRGGLNMRIQTPGKTVRFYGSLGGGFVFESLDFSYPGVTGLATCVLPRKSSDIPNPSCADVEGYDGYFLIEGGLQLSLGGVLVDAAIGTNLQSTRQFGKGTYKDWLPIFEAGLRVGYAFW